MTQKTVFDGKLTPQRIGVFCVGLLARPTATLYRRVSKEV